MSAQEVVAYVTQSIIWAVIWFSVGFSVAWVVRQESPRHAVLRTTLGLIVLGIVVYQTWTGQKIAECQRQNNADFAAQQIDRIEAAAIDREANKIRWRFIKEVLAAPVTAPLSLEEQNANRARWLNDLNEADRLVAEAEAKRAQAPPPNPYQVRECR